MALLCNRTVSYCLINKIPEMKIILFILLAFVAFTACICGVIMIGDPQGHILNIPLFLLKTTPFKDFFIPGCILLATGIVNTIAAYGVLLRNRYLFISSFLAGIVICGWIIVQMIMIQFLFGLQFLYLGIGIVIMTLSFFLTRKEKASAHDPENIVV